MFELDLKTFCSRNVNGENQNFENWHYFFLIFCLEFKKHTHDMEIQKKTIVRPNKDDYESWVWYKFASLTFCLVDLIRPINNISVIKGWVFLDWTSTKLWLMCLAQGRNTVRLKHAAPQSRVKTTTEPLRFRLHLIQTYRWHVQFDFNLQ